MKRVVYNGTTCILGNTTNPTHHIIISHGLGDTAKGLLPYGQRISEAFPSCMITMPTAPIQPVTINGGMKMNAWYDIKGLDDHKDPCIGIDESCTVIRKLVTDSKVAPCKTVLTGFSQGGALSLFTGLTWADKEPFAGIICLSGYLPRSHTLSLSEFGRKTDVLHCHGTKDGIVDPDYAKLSQRVARVKGVQNYELKEFEGLGHSVSEEEVEVVISKIRSWLK